MDFEVANRNILINFIIIICVWPSLGWRRLSVTCSFVLAVLRTDNAQYAKSWWASQRNQRHNVAKSFECKRLFSQNCYLFWLLWATYDCHSDNGYCLFIRCPFPFIAFCVAATVYRYLFSMRPLIAPNDEFIASFVLAVRDKAVYFIFISVNSTVPAAGDRATVVKIVSQTRNDRKRTTYSSTPNHHIESISQNNCAPKKKKIIVAHILFGLSPKADACAWHCFVFSRLETAYHEFATALKMVCVRIRCDGRLAEIIVETDTGVHSLAFVRVASVTFQSGCAHSSRRQAKRRIIEF